MAAEEILRLKDAGVLCPHCELKQIQDKCCQEFCGDAYDNYLNVKDDMRVEAEVLNANNDELPKHPDGWVLVKISDELYVCNPMLNTGCKKSDCRIHGGPCYATKEIQFAEYQPVMGCRIREGVPYDLDQHGVQKCEPTDHCYEVTSEGELMYEEGETVIVPKDEYRKLVYAAHMLDCLDANGLEDWEGYDLSQYQATERMKDFDDPGEDVVSLPEDYWKED